MGHEYIGDNGRAVILTEKSMLKTDAITGGRNAKPSELKEPKNSDQPKELKWAPWGDNDDFPIKLNEKIGLIGVMATGLDLNASDHFGKGPIWGRDEYTEDGKIIFKPERVAFWAKMVRDFGAHIVQAELIESLENYYLAFAEFILSNDGEEITSVKALDTCYCRFAKRDSQGKIKSIFYSSDFGTDTPDNPPEIPIYDPMEPKKHKKFVVVLQYRTFGNFYYPEPIFYTCIRNGWADVAISIPKMLKYIYENQMSLKYIIRVPYEVMKRMYSAWDTPPGCEGADAIMKWQQAKIEEVHQKVNDHLTKPENQYKSLFTFVEGPHELKGIEVEPIKNYLDATAELPNAAAANQEILFAEQVDPSRLGLGIPGGKNLSGSGSDKRESQQIKKATLERERNVSLQVLMVMAKHYDYDAEVYPRYLDSDTSQTMDQNPTGSKTVV